MAALLAGLATIEANTTSIPACPSKTCAPCYISASPLVLTYPGIYYDIQNETYTLNVTPHVTTFPNGSVSTIYETQRRNMSTAMDADGSTITYDMRLEEAYTWIANGIGDKNLTLTYPTTYIQWNYALLGVTATNSETATKCAQVKGFSDITLPQTADPSRLINLPSRTDVNPKWADIPTSIIDYLDSLPEVQDQFNHIPLTSCSNVIHQPSVCTHVVTSTSTSCLSAAGSGNLSYTHCSETIVTWTSTRNIAGARPTQAMTTNPINFPRQPAAYLTYKTLSGNSEASESPADLAPNIVTSPTMPFHKESQQGPMSTVQPDVSPSSDPPPHETSTAGSSSAGQDPNRDNNGDSQHAPQKGSQPVVTQPEATQKPASNAPGNIESAIGALASKASASLGGATAPALTNGPSNDPDVGNTPQPTLSAGLGNLWSAIQGVASHAAESDGSAPASHAEEATGTAKPGSSQGSQQGSGHGDAAAAHDTENNPSAAPGSDVPEVPPDSSTGEVTGGPTLGDAHSSQNAAGNGVAAGTDDTSSSNEETEGPAAPEATVNNVPFFTFAGQALSPGAAVTFGGSHASELPSGDGVVIDGSQTVHLSEGQATTLHQSNHEPVTISRSNSIFAINGETLSPGQQITAGQTTASLAQSSSVMYVNGVPTTLAGPSITLGGTAYTASPILSTSSGGLGSYIYDGIGGLTATASGSSRDGTGSATGASSSSTGAASRSLECTDYGWPIAMIVLWLT